MGHLEPFEITPEFARRFIHGAIEVAVVPVTGPDGLPLRLFGNQIVHDVARDGYFGIVDKYGMIHWIEIGY